MEAIKMCIQRRSTLVFHWMASNEHAVR
jgi:hypothetical protein